MAWKHNYKPPKGYVEKPPRGPGWGGDAKGEGKAFSATNQPSPEAKSAGKAAAATAKAMAQEHAVEMMQLLLSIARDPNTPSVTRADIAEKVINRGEGKATTMVGGDAEAGPVKTVIAWEDGA